MMHLIYLTVLFLTLIVYNIMLIVKTFSLSLEDLEEEHKEEDFSAKELEQEKIALLIILVLALPSHFLVY